MNPDDTDDLPLDGSDGNGLGIRQFVTLGAMVTGCVVFFLVAGVLLDLWLDSSPLFLLVGTAVGVVLAATGFWLRVRAYLQG